MRFASYSGRLGALPVVGCCPNCATLAEPSWRARPRVPSMPSSVQSDDLAWSST